MGGRFQPEQAAELPGMRTEMGCPCSPTPKVPELDQYGIGTQASSEIAASALWTAFSRRAVTENRTQGGEHRPAVEAGIRPQGELAARPSGSHPGEGLGQETGGPPGSEGRSTPQPGVEHLAGVGSGNQ